MSLLFILFSSTYITYKLSITWVFGNMTVNIIETESKRKKSLLSWNFGIDWEIDEMSIGK